MGIAGYNRGTRLIEREITAEIHRRRGTFNPDLAPTRKPKPRPATYGDKSLKAATNKASKFLRYVARYDRRLPTVDELADVVQMETSYGRSLALKAARAAAQSEGVSLHEIVQRPDVAALANLALVTHPGFSAMTYTHPMLGEGVLVSDGGRRYASMREASNAYAAVASSLAAHGFQQHFDPDRSSPGEYLAFFSLNPNAARKANGAVGPTLTYDHGRISAAMKVGRRAWSAVYDPTSQAGDVSLNGEIIGGVAGPQRLGDGSYDFDDYHATISLSGADSDAFDAFRARLAKALLASAAKRPRKGSFRPTSVMPPVDQWDRIPNGSRRWTSPAVDRNGSDVVIEYGVDIDGQHAEAWAAEWREGWRDMREVARFTGTMREATEGLRAWHQEATASRPTRSRPTKAARKGNAARYTTSRPPVFRRPEVRRVDGELRFVSHHAPREWIDVAQSFGTDLPVSLFADSWVGQGIDLDEAVYNLQRGITDPREARKMRVQPRR